MRNPVAILTPILAFSAAFGLAAWMMHSPAATRPSSTAEAGSSNEAALRNDLIAERTALISEVRSFLRAGDVEGARKLLADSAREDPEVLFFALEKLPSFPGIKDEIRSAAARLPWKEKRITALLNRVSSPEWRDLAWEAYAGAHVGKVSDEEVFQTVLPARRSDWTAGLKTLMESAAVDRPESFMDLLNREGGSSFR